MADEISETIFALVKKIVGSSINQTSGILFLILPLLVIVLYGVYNVYLHPLRGYPGPLMWRAFRIPYVVSTQRGVFHKDLKAFHATYGPVVRIAPNELSYADSGAWKDIYQTRPGQPLFERNRIWLQKPTPDAPSSIMSYDEDDHARFRRAFANSFSEKSYKEQLPVVESYVDLLIQQLKVRKTADLAKWFNYLSFDLTGDLSFGESFDCLKNGEAHPWVEIAQDYGKGLALFATVNMYPPLDKLLKYIIPKKIIQRTEEHQAISAAKIRKRLALKTDRPDFVTPTKKYNDEKHKFTGPEWDINMLIIAFASSETVASALTAIVRELMQNEDVLLRLTKELRETFAEEKDITVATTTNLTYLNAVINEGLRLSPPVVIGVPRIAPPGGAMVCGRFVPAGTYVEYNQFAANRQSYNFCAADSFVPERFINPDPNVDDMAGFQPFGMGRHGCLGMKLAYAEMRVTLARFVWGFDLKLVDEGDRWDWGVQKTYILWDKKPLDVLLEWAH